jgi:hypothetical protein
LSNRKINPTIKAITRKPKIASPNAEIRYPTTKRTIIPKRIVPINFISPPLEIWIKKYTKELEYF